MLLTVNRTSKLNIIALILLTSSGGALAASDSATVNITATVSDNTCTPEWDSAGVDVPMGKASLRDFASQGDVALTKIFNLKLDNCGQGASRVKVTASGEPDNYDPKAFKNVIDASSSGAGGVAITIFGDATQSTQMMPDGSSSVEYDVDSESKTVDMKFLAKLEQSSSTAATAGDVKSVVNMTVDYE
ncbi:fimbrial protein [Yersinia ruckeri]|uniref:fimbrial protein n=1 Tax=Yersinia ruckeri TaxID=29486 RepID=UPI0004E44575|nr:fimbrial protein [Yersinia ruckeri]ARZ00123.1 S-fimbrial protein subunit SfaG precursor [Yersinia ruckeri]AUQ42228.1 long polar fimbrial protein LpfE [Yersinia ruckeri]EKN4688876.1 type 1 fimbrial protein [Yersinia ruckeri]ELM3739082.1 type 1 fimbrial protein [Yersinia ruckeri]KFE38568.1 fimbrial-like adhesin protein [Yersinia ruckeri]